MTSEEGPLSSRPRRDTRRLVLLVLCLLAAFLLVSAGEAPARMGGGEGFTSGGSGSGGSGFGGSGSSVSGSSGDGFLLYLLLDLALRHPLVGVPLLVVLLVAVYGAGRSGHSRHVSRRIRAAYRSPPLGSPGAAAAALERLQQRDPGFSPDAFASRCIRLFPTLQEAWTRGSMQPVRACLSDGVYERLQIQLAMMEACGVRNTVSEVRVKSARVAGVRSDAFFDTVHLAITASARDETVRVQNGARVGVGHGDEPFTEIWSFLRRPGARTLSSPGLLEGFCPNCGTRLEVGDSAVCPSCRSVINSGEYDWVLAEITQEVVWQDRPDRTVPGLEAMVRKDPAFNVQHLEDKASVMFWRHRAAEFFGSEAYLKKLAAPEYLDRARPLFQSLPDGTRRFLADAALGSVEVMDIVLAESGGARDAVRVKITASGHTEVARLPTFLPPAPSRSSPLVQEYILERNADARTSAKNTLTSAHCPGCGAPETLSTSGACEYCGLPQNDGGSGWVLARVRPFTGAPLVTGTGYASSVARELGIAALGPRVSLPRLSPVENEALLACAAAVMRADGHVDPRERMRLVQMAAGRGIPEERLDALTGAAGDAGACLPEEGDPLRKQEFLRSLVIMCLADGNVSRSERAVIQRLGERLGYGSHDIDRLIRQDRAALYRESRRARGAV